MEDLTWRDASIRDTLPAAVSGFFLSLASLSLRWVIVDRLFYFFKDLIEGVRHAIRRESVIESCQGRLWIQSLHPELTRYFIFVCICVKNTGSWQRSFFNRLLELNSFPSVEPRQSFFLFKQFLIVAADEAVLSSHQLVHFLVHSFALWPRTWYRNWPRLSLSRFFLVLYFLVD